MLYFTPLSLEELEDNWQLLCCPDTGKTIARRLVKPNVEARLERLDGSKLTFSIAWFDCSPEAGFAEQIIAEAEIVFTTMLGREQAVLH